MFKSMMLTFLLFNFIQSNSMPVSYIELSEQMMEGILNQENVEPYQKILARAKWSEIRTQLNDDVKKQVFWLNIYNAYIQLQLLDNPGKYADKNEFFNTKGIFIA